MAGERAYKSPTLSRVLFSRSGENICTPGVGRTTAEARVERTRITIKELEEAPTWLTRVCVCV